MKSKTKNTSRQKSRCAPFWRFLHLFDGVSRLFSVQFDSLYAKNECYNPKMSALTYWHLVCKMAHWYLLVVLGSMGLLGLPHMPFAQSLFASSCAIASCQVSGTETVGEKHVLGRFALFGTLCPRKKCRFEQEMALSKKVKRQVFGWSRTVLSVWALRLWLYQDTLEIM